MIAGHGSTTLLLALAAAILAIVRISTFGHPATLAALLAALRNAAGERGPVVVVAWIASMGVPKVDRVDVAQSALMRAVTAWPRFDPDFNKLDRETQSARTQRRRALFAGWMYRITARSAAAYFAQRYRSAEILMAAPLDPESPDPRPGAEAKVAARESKEHLLEAIRHLDPDTAAIVVARDLHGTPMEEIAESTGIPLSTVYKMRARARATLRAALERRAAR
ncbi:sigma-70 family RNA polymerase sigma factor [Sorangium sp. So ce321]|uniref:sigma-70 family RNA polymerase sigma factor n=1 Tax=Sorangium sp. So ce321 TaxID=3133300 RepID=UPI003F624ABB